MTLTLRTGVSVAETDYGLALLDERSGEYWNLNPTGAVVLKTLLAGGTPEQAAQQLCQDHDVDPALATEDVAELVEEFRGAGLIEPAATRSRPVRRAR